MSQEVLDYQAEYTLDAIAKTITYRRYWVSSRLHSRSGMPARMKDMRLTCYVRFNDTVYTCKLNITRGFFGKFAELPLPNC